MGTRFSLELFVMSSFPFLLPTGGYEGKLVKRLCVEGLSQAGFFIVIVLMENPVSTPMSSSHVKHISRCIEVLQSSTNCSYCWCLEEEASLSTDMSADGNEMFDG